MNQFELELIKEPLLEFGNDFLSSDPKTGITLGGFFSTSIGVHRSEIHYSIIGTQVHMELVKNYIQKFESRIQASIKYKEDKIEESIIIDGHVVEDKSNDEEDEEMSDQQLQTLFGDLAGEDKFDEDSTFILNKKTNPDFPGFNNAGSFKCSFKNDDSNNKTIREIQINNILEDAALKKFDKAIRIADLYINAYKELLEDTISKPNVCFIVIPSEVFKKLSSIKWTNNIYFNLRRYLKAQLISIPNSIPVQIIIEDTLKGTKKSIQDLSMQAWNFVVANYYKNGGIPWSVTLKDKSSCFIGISFHRVLDSDESMVRSSIAQAFNYEGKGIIFIGKQFEWDSHKTNTKAPHLTHDYARDLIKNVLKEYKKYNKVLPSRVVIHKTTDFWDTAFNKDYAEAEGFRYGINEVLGEEVTIDLVTVKSSNLKLLRSKGKYPVLRGSLLKMSDKYGLLYTTGYIPYFESYPGVHIPRPLEISIYSGDSTIRKVSEEIMALTKLNFNNCSYYDSLPITIRFAQRVGEIIQYISDTEKIPNKYYYYM